MARSRTSSTDTTSHGRSAQPHGSSRSNGHGSSQGAVRGDGEHSPSGEYLGDAQDWVNGPLAAPKKAVDSLLEMQCQWLKTASMGNETLAMELKELQQARDPVQFMSAQFSLANQQMEIVSRQVSAVMQQLYDAQLMWLGQWDDKSEAAQAAQSPENPAPTALDAMGRMQDDWLKATQNWIDSVNSATRSR